MSEERAEYEFQQAPTEGVPRGNNSHGKGTSSKDEAERRQTQRKVQQYLVARMVEVSDLLDLDVITALADEIAKQESVMPIMDPTRWIRERKSLAATRAVMQAAVDFARTVAEHKARPR